MRGLEVGQPADWRSAADAVSHLKRGYRAELLVSTRDSGLVGGVIVLLALPLWWLFDVAMEPEQAPTFLVVRAIAEVLALLIWLALRHPTFGARWAESLVFALLSVVQIGVAWMIPRVEQSLEAYLLGFSLAIYGSAFLLVWRWQLSLAIGGLSGAAVAVMIAINPGTLTFDDLATVAFYLTTATILAVIGQRLRNRLAWQEYAARSALHKEQERTQSLLAELDRLSREDDLTHVANRRSWDEHLTKEFDRAGRDSGPLSVLLLDVDRFKDVNDSHGHAVGDEVIRHLAALMRGRSRPGDVVARLGGDEFALLCPDTGLDGAVLLAVDLWSRARSHPWPRNLPVTVSVGAATALPTDSGPDALLARADVELYRAKGTRDSVWCDGRRRDAEDGSGSGPEVGEVARSV